MQEFDFDLGETIDALRDAVRQFAQARIAPLAEQTDRDNAFPLPLWSELGDMGLLGLTVEEKFGGTDMGYLARGALARGFTPGCRPGAATHRPE